MKRSAPKTSAAKPAKPKPAKPAASKAKKVGANPSAKRTPAAPAEAAEAPAKRTKIATASTATKQEATTTVPWAPDAIGLSRIRAGFGKTPADDVLFALGYPHIVVPTDEAEPKGARDPSKVWKLFPLRSVTHVPRSFLPYVYGYHLNYRTAAELFAGPPPTYKLADEMKGLFRRNNRLLFLLEAMFGSEAVATAAVEFLCTCPLTEWKSRELDEAGWNGIRNLGFVLLRVSPSTRTKLVAKLEALFKKVSGSQGKEWWRPVQALDIMLHGRVGITRNNEGWFDLAHEREDAAWVAEQALAKLKTMKPADRAMVDAQIGFIGGPRVVKEMSNLKLFFSENHSDAKKQLARIR